ncbi:MAG: hypothetical protein AAGB29_12020 [Planctomycetota bacterium]
MFEELLRNVPSDFWGAMAHVLWRVDYADPLSATYSVINLLEAVAWFAVAAWVLRRHVKQGGGGWNYAYAAAFVVFGLSDVLESQMVPIWLVAAKGVIFGLILWLRYEVLRRYYPGRKL